MITSRIQDLTLAELQKLCQRQSEEAYERYVKAIHSSDEITTDQMYKQWADTEDCLYAINRVLEMVKLNPNV